MANEKDPNEKPKLPPLPFPLPGGSAPSLPPSLPPLPTALPRSAPPPPPPPQAGGPGEVPKEDLGKKVSELEKRLMEEREKVLLANLKSQQESVTASKVEMAIKELQEKIRRERQDRDREEARLGLEGKLREMEGRLAQERETWVETLRRQMQTRESTDKEMEAHFAMRLQEIERRSLEERAQWQRALLAKEEEVRTLRPAADRVKSLEFDIERAAGQKALLEARISELMQDRAHVETLKEKSARAAIEIERASALKAAIEEKLSQALQEKSLSAAQVEALKERASKAEAELHKKDAQLESLVKEEDRLKTDHARETDHLKAEHAKEEERLKAELMRLRGICGAIERQAAPLRTANAQFKLRLEDVERRMRELLGHKASLERQLAAQAALARKNAEALDIEKVKLRVLAEEEVKKIKGRLIEDIRKEEEARFAKREADLRAEFERSLPSRMLKIKSEWEGARSEMAAEMGRLQEEVARLHRALVGKDAEREERLLEKEKEINTLKAEISATAGKSDRLNEERREAIEAKVSLEKSLVAENTALKSRLAELEASDTAQLLADKAELQRCLAAQAALARDLKEGLDTDKARSRAAAVAALKEEKKEDEAKRAKLLQDLERSRKELESSRRDYASLESRLAEFQKRLVAAGAKMKEALLVPNTELAQAKERLAESERRFEELSAWRKRFEAEAESRRAEAAAQKEEAEAKRKEEAAAAERRLSELMERSAEELKKVKTELAARAAKELEDKLAFEAQTQEALNSKIQAQAQENAALEKTVARLEAELRKGLFARLFKRS